MQQVKTLTKLVLDEYLVYTKWQPIRGQAIIRDAIDKPIEVLPIQFGERNYLSVALESPFT